MSWPPTILQQLDDIAPNTGFFATTAGVIRWDTSRLVIEIGPDAIELPNTKGPVSFKLWRCLGRQLGRFPSPTVHFGVWLGAELSCDELGITLVAPLAEPDAVQTLAPIAFCDEAPPQLHEVEPAQLWRFLKAVHNLGVPVTPLGAVDHDPDIIETQAQPEFDHEVVLEAEDLQDPQSAIAAWREQLEREPSHGEALQNLSALYEQSQNWRELIEVLELRAAAASSPEVLANLRYRMAELLEDHLGDTAGATELLRQVLETTPTDLDTLSRLACLYARTSDDQALSRLIRHIGEVTDSASAVLARLAARLRQADQPERSRTLLAAATRHCQDPKERAKLHVALAELYADALNQPVPAVREYNAALDSDPTNFDAFSAIEALLSKTKNWDMLERNYREMLKRAQALSPKHRRILWQHLAALYRDVLGDTDNAIAAYEVLLRLEPDNTETRMVLADVYAQAPARRRDAIALYHQLATALDNPQGAVKGLRQLYQGEKNFDAVFVMCTTLVFMAAADQEERETANYLARGIPPRATRCLNDQHWKLAQHRDLDCVIGRLAATLDRRDRERFLSGPKDLGLRPKDRVELRDTDLMIGHIVHRTSHALGLHLDHIYVTDGDEPEPWLASTQPAPALVMSKGLVRPDHAGNRAMLFGLARTLAYMRAELFLAHVFKPHGLQNLLFGLCLAFNRDAQHRGDSAAVGAWAEFFTNMPKQALQQLQPMVAPAHQALLEPDAMQRYCAAVEHTANAIGLLVCGDLNAAWASMKERTDLSTPVAPRNQLEELIRFSTSTNHLQLRQAIGAALVVSAANNEAGSSTPPAG